MITLALLSSHPEREPDLIAAAGDGMTGVFDIEVEPGWFGWTQQEATLPTWLTSVVDVVWFAWEWHEGALVGTSLPGPAPGEPWSWSACLQALANAA